ncbi:MAG: hypothetical protein HDS64_02165 [Bacteroidales bacterium]|nr:hypothetical protein [Bacteroidales bacterium]MBD5294338.1 hypothetical protein [Bacteroides sp.]MDE6428571.1 hypothetical protein [Muribaculaceae bacterium]MBD5342747.1 hypothetical protein [Bacteroides sp.]MBD5351376.1 hypothetical protein [Bacteroides sp.]
MAEIYSSDGIIRLKSNSADNAPRPATLIYLRQFARAYSPLYGGLILN